MRSNLRNLVLGLLVVGAAASAGLAMFGKYSDARAAALGDALAAHSPHDGYTVVELFTSQGCSSCPPADALLSELTRDYSDKVLTLSYHVDYWNYIGWSDPFSKAEFSDYQRQYASSWNTRRIYTPQAIVNGRHDVVGSQRNRLLGALVDAKDETLKVDITPQGENASAQSTYLVSANAELKGAQMVFIQYIPAQTTQVTRGENRGRNLTHHHIVTSRNVLGVFDGAAMHLTLNKRNQHGAVIIFQEPKTMRIIAATKLS